MARAPEVGEESEPPTATADDATSITAIEAHIARRPPIEQVQALTVAGRVDRFLVLEKLGEGGMGAVYVAYDTLLDRKVAMKVVRPDRRGSATGGGPRERLLREAQAMARLSHPNVVAVLEVGELGDDIYLALELVEGSTLKAWLRAQPRPWQQIIATFVAAGRGLAAAHAAGLVHRDFKPDNVLIGVDGRVRVADFGVVSMSHGQRDASATPPGVEVGDSSSDAFTFTGLRVGTPAYMAPEQYEGESVDARADQFSFCVALWEALYGERPFVPLAAGGSFRERAMRAIPADTAVPGWVEPLLRRGLSLDAAQRWSSMDPLIAELARDRRVARRRAAMIGGVAAVLAVTGGLAFAGWTRDRAGAPRPCSDEGRHLAGVWDPAQARALEESFRATGAPGAAGVAARVRGHLDRWSQAWVTMRTETCAATRIHGDQSELVLDQRMRCLDRRLGRVAALVKTLSTLDRGGLARAVEITADLPALEACADPEQLTAVAPPPDDARVRERVQAIERELERATAIERTGRYPEALAVVTPAVLEARATGHAPILAEAMAIRGRLEGQSGDLDASVATLREASTLAAAAHADDVAADSLVELVWTMGEEGKAGDALAVSIGAAAAVARVHDPRREATLIAHLGSVHMIGGDLDAATRELERALRLVAAAYGPEHVRVAQVLNRLGNVASQRGRTADARAYYERALAVAEAAVGPEHPSVAVTRANICYIDATAGKLEDARACQARVVATLEAALGAEHPQVAWALNDLGLVEQSRGDATAARALFERALAIWEKTSGPDHPDVAWPLVNLAELARGRGETQDAEALCRRALRIVETASGRAHPDTVHPLVCLGTVLAETRPAEAHSLLERALAVAAELGDDVTTGTARFALARAALAEHDRGAAAEHARAAATAFEAAGAGSVKEAAEVRDWMRRQRL